MKRNLKKAVLALLLSALMILLAFPVTADEAEEGEYYRISSFKQGDQEYGEDLLSMIGLEAYMILREDGTGILSFDGEDQEIIWTEDAISIDGGESVPYTRDGDSITVENEDGAMTFTLGEPSEDDTPAVLTPAPFDPDTRAGYYKLASMEADGEVTNGAVFEALGMDIFLVMNEDGTGQLCLFGMGVDITWDDDAFTADGESTEYTYDEGSITMESEGSKLVFVYADTPDKAPETGDLDLGALENLEELGTLEGELEG